MLDFFFLTGEGEQCQLKYWLSNWKEYKNTWTQWLEDVEQYT